MFEVNITTGDTTCLCRPYHSKFFKGCLPQISLGPFLNTLCHMHIVPRIANCGKKIYIYTLKCYMEANETIMLAKV